jgi:hypothetical protein
MRQKQSLRPGQPLPALRRFAIDMAERTMLVELEDGTTAIYTNFDAEDPKATWQVDLAKGDPSFFYEENLSQRTTNRIRLDLKLDLNGADITIDRPIIEVEDDFEVRPITLELSQ